jgi:hypothetical protein
MWTMNLRVCRRVTGDASFGLSFNQRGDFVAQLASGEPIEPRPFIHVAGSERPGEADLHRIRDLSEIAPRCIAVAELLATAK